MISLARTGETLSAVNMVGLVVFFLGILAHIVHKVRNMKRDEAELGKKASRSHIHSHQLLSSSSDSEDDLSYSESEGMSSKQHLSHMNRQIRQNRNLPRNSSRSGEVVQGGDNEGTSEPLLWDHVMMEMTSLSSDDDSTSSADDGKDESASAKVKKIPAGQMSKVSGMKGSASWQDVEDSFFLRENRKWTSIRDQHLSMSETSLAETGGKSTARDKDKSGVVTGDLINPN